MRALKSEFIENLKTFGALSKFVTFLFKVGGSLSASPDEALVSTLLLELRADYLRDVVMTSREKALSDEKGSGAQILTSDDGNQLYIYRAKEPTEMFYF